MKHRCLLVAVLVRWHYFVLEEEYHLVGRPRVVALILLSAGTGALGCSHNQEEVVAAKSDVDNRALVAEGSRKLLDGHQEEEEAENNSTEGEAGERDRSLEDHQEAEELCLL